MNTPAKISLAAVAVTTGAAVALLTTPKAVVNPEPIRNLIPVPPLGFSPDWVESSTNLKDWQFEPVQIYATNPTVWNFEGKNRPNLYFRFVKSP